MYLRFTAKLRMRSLYGTYIRKMKIRLINNILLHNHVHIVIHIENIVFIRDRDIRLKHFTKMCSHG